MKALIILTLALVVLSANGKFFYRTVWWPGCECGEVEWESEFSTKASCKAVIIFKILIKKL